MNKAYKTQQEEFWAGEFGNEYISRNEGQNWVTSNVALFSKIFSRCEKIHSLIEFGSNNGLNLRAIRNLYPNFKLGAIEINQTAVEQLKAWGGVDDLYHTSILDFAPEKTWNVSLIKGVLIHIDPNQLQKVYEALYRSTNRYIVVAEYYNPTPVELSYRGHTGKLFKRDFAGEIMDKYPDLKLVDYGFAWHRDPQFPQDDCTWFLLEKP